MSRLTVALLLLTTLPASAHAERRADDPRARLRQAPFEEVELQNQDGLRVGLYRDLLRGKVVVINAFYTSCETVCPMASATLARIQSWLGDRLGDEVHMLSLTLDPSVDSPAKLKEYATRFEARPGWVFVTGPPDRLERALEQLGHTSVRKEAHGGMLLIANEPRGLWRKISSLSTAQEIQELIDEVARAR